MLFKVNKNASSADLAPPDLVHEIETYPPKIFPLSFLNKHIVGPLLSHFK